MWFSSPLQINFSHCPELEFSEWLKYILQVADKQSLNLACAITDSIWLLARNLKVFEDKEGLYYFRDYGKWTQ